VKSAWFYGACMAAVLLGQACNSDSRQLLERADARWREGNYDDAIRLNTLLYQRDRQGKYGAQALLNIGNIYYLNLRQIKNAIDAYKKVAAEMTGRPEEYKAREKLATIYENEVGDLTQAILEYDRILQAKDLENLAEIQFKRANDYFRKEDFDRALRELRSLEESGVTGHLAHQIFLKIGSIYQIRQKYEDAIGYFEKVTQSACPECRQRSILNLAESYEALYDIDGAVESLRKLDPTPDNERLVRQETSRLLDKRRRLNSAATLTWKKAR
jgi:tetratricopeptide (TPR) repeat protein